MGLFKNLFGKGRHGTDSKDENRTSVRGLKSTGDGQLYRPQNDGRFMEHFPVADLGFCPEKPRVRPLKPQRSDSRPPAAEPQRPRSRKDSLSRQPKVYRRRNRPGPPVPPKNDVEFQLLEVHRPFSFVQDEPLQAPLQESSDAQVSRFPTRPRGFGDDLFLELPASLQHRGTVRRGRTVAERFTGPGRDDNASHPRQVREAYSPTPPTSSRVAQVAEVNANSMSFASRAYHDSQRLAYRRLDRSRTHGHCVYPSKSSHTLDTHQSSQI